ncbi:hypothetical protein SAMN05428943_5935 [Streptomyces sp. 2314.4]|nr:hypothetical protein SAMN05428943_5935 [Streptomyces sp. 2314.4]
MADSSEPQAEPPCDGTPPPSPTEGCVGGGPAGLKSPGSPAPRSGPSRNGLDLAALIAAVLGVVILIVLGVVGPIRPLFWTAGVFGAAALVLGILGARRAKQGAVGNRGRALTGAVLGGLATVWFVNGVAVASDPFHEVSCQAGPLRFQTTRCFDDGLQVTVSAPKPYTPRKMGQSSTDYPVGSRTVSVEITIRNGSPNMVDLENLWSIGGKDANGHQATPIWEGDDLSRGLGHTQLLPGMTTVRTQGFALPPSAAKSMGVEVSLVTPPDVGIGWNRRNDTAWWSGPVR